MLLLPKNGNQDGEKQTLVVVGAWGGHMVCEGVSTSSEGVQNSSEGVLIQNVVTRREEVGMKWEGDEKWDETASWAVDFAIKNDC